MSKIEYPETSPGYAQRRKSSPALQSASCRQETPVSLCHLSGSDWTPTFRVSVSRLLAQDVHGGLGPLIPGWQPPPPVAAASGVGPEWVEYSSAAASTVGEFDADEFSMAEGASEASGVQRLPDFKSMLEAALRGDVVRYTPEFVASATVQLSTVWKRVACHLCRGKPFMRNEVSEVQLPKVWRRLCVQFV